MKKQLLFSLFAFLFLFNSESVDGQCNRSSDSLALVAIYDSLGGAGWTYMATSYWNHGIINSLPNVGIIWDFNQPIDTWHGVQLNSNGCVEVLVLKGNNLIGSLFDFNLSNLQYLNLAHNQLSGNIPNFTDLPNLTQLRLSNNQLSGNIPNFTNLPNLTQLRLYNNQLSGNIPDFTNLSNLQSLHLYINQLSGSIPDFTNLFNLMYLYLHDNQLSGSIPDFSNLPNLILLSLDNNQLSGSIPDFSDNLTNLQDLEIQENNFTFESITNTYGVNNTLINNNSSNPSFYFYDYSPQDSAGVIQNISLNTGDTYTIALNFDDTVTTSIYRWYKDGVLFDSTTTNQYIITNAQLSDAGQYDVQVTNSIATALTLNVRPIILNVQMSCRMLDSLALVELYDSLGGVNWTYTSTNYLPGSPLLVPNAGNSWNFNQPINTWHGIELDSNGCVESLILNDNGLNGFLFDINLSNLKSLYLHDNQLSGNIPSFSYLSNLNVLYLANNQLTGSIPDFSNLNQLTTLRLFFNQLSGNIPDFSNIPNLSSLYLYGNQLTGSIPNFTNLPNLIDVRLFSNQLSGNLPNFSNLPKIKELQLYGNQLTGNIPDFTHIPTLQFLTLNNNLLQGSIPNFTNLPNLTDISLNSNDLTGFIPDFSNLPNLTTILLNTNNLTDSIPDFTNLPNLQFLSLYQNKLSGTIPDFSDNILSLKWMTIYNNQFTFENINSSYDNNNTLINNNATASYHIYEYAPQDSTGITQTVLLQTNDTYTIDLNIDDTVTTSTYYWYKDGILFDSTTTNQYTLSNIQLSDSGQYDIRVTNSITTDLTLYIRPITLSVQLSCRTLDSLALVELYDSTNGANWTNTWDLNQLIDTWYGVTINSSGCVDSLILKNNNLVGNLMDLNLPNLNYLDLSHNSLQGGLVDFSMMNNLIRLYLDNNQISGNLIDFTSLPNLEWLYLDSNQITGNIPNFSNFPNLKVLNLHTNQLTGNIPNFTNLPNLLGLYLHNNQLSGNIPNFTNLSNLAWLYLHHNDLEGTVPNFTNLNSLSRLYVYTNQLDSCPSFSNLLNLQDLRVYDNQFTVDDLLPNVGKSSNIYSYSPQDSIGTIQNITLNTGDTYTIHLTIDDNVTTSTYYWYQNGVLFDSTTTNKYIFNYIKPMDDGIYTVSITNPIIPNLTLYVRPITLDVNITCSYTDSLALVELYDSTNGANWTNTWDLNQPMTTWNGVTLNQNGCVIELSLNNNNLVGHLPDLNLPNLEKLYLSQNQLIGTLIDFTNLSSLQDLNFQSNQLSGNIPDFTNLPNLTKLYLGDNNLSGNIPNFTNLPNLEYINWGYNQLNGNIPNFTNLPNLIQLALYDNQLSGSIPNFTSLPNLTTLSLHTNELTGIIPNLANCSSLEYINFAINQLSSTIPNFILSNLRTLVLNDNQLTGAVPNLVGTPSITSLNFHNNNIIACSDLSVLSNLVAWRCYGNALTFDDITDNITIVSSILEYAPQDSVGSVQNQFATIGQPFTLQLPFDSTVTTSTYYWYLNGILVDSTINNYYTISNVQPSNLGRYDIVVTNSIATDLTLYIRPVFLDGCPAVDLGNDTTICVGNPIILSIDTVTGATYQWNTGETTPHITVTPTTNTTYSTTLTFGNCVIKDTINIDVYPVSTYNLDTTLCIGQNIIINGVVYDKLNPTGTEILIGASYTGCDSLVNINLIFKGEKPIITSCPSNINLNTTVGLCTNTATWTEPTAIDSCGTTVNYTSRSHAPNSTFSVGITTITYVFGTLLDTSICYFNITVTDNEPTTVISFPTDIIAYADTDSCGTHVSWTPPNIIDNCGNVNLIAQSHQSGDFFVTDTTTVTYQYQDTNGNDTILSFDIIVIDTIKPTYSSFPTDTTIFTNPNNCTSLYNWIAPIPSDNCGIQSSTVNITSGSTFNLGTTTITYTLTDVNGLIITQNFEVTVEDHQPPTTLTFPNDIIAYADTDSCGTHVSWAPPNIIDNCGNINLITQSHQSGDFFVTDTTTVTYQYQDTNGNDTILSFDIIVIDTIKPVFSNFSVAFSDTIKSCNPIVTWTSPTITDNCNIVSTSSTHSPNQLFPVGVTDVYYTAIDVNGNVNTYHFVILIHPPTQSIIHSTNVLCKGGSTGTAVAQPISGTPPFNYSWNTAPLQITDTINNLLAGIYAITITDANNCSDTNNVTITEPIALTTSINLSTPVSCFGGMNGTATTTTNGGVGNYDYLWDNNETTTTAMNLNKGWHYITVTDANQCVVIDSVLINEPDSLTVNSFINKTINCYYGGSMPNTGELSCNPLGGDGNYTYTWQHNNTLIGNQQTITNLLPGIYTINITDNNGCNTTDSITLPAPQLFNAILTETKPIICPKDSATIKLNVNGGTTPYSLTSNNINLPNPLQIDSTIEFMVPAGIYQISVTDSLGCVIAASEAVIAPDTFDIQFLVEQSITCFNDSTGKISSTVTGGSFPYSYQWNNGVTSLQNTNLKSGWYQLTITDNNGCIATNNTYLPQPSKLNLQIDTTYNCDTRKGTIVFHAMGGTPPYLYNDGNQIQSDSQFINLPIGNHQFTITDFSVCQVDTTISLGENCDSCSLYQPLSLLSEEYLCLGNNLGELKIKITGGQPQYDNNATPYYFDMIINGNSLPTTTTFLGEYTNALQNGDDWELKVYDISGCDTLLLVGYFEEDTFNCNNFCELYPLEINRTSDTIILPKTDVELWVTGKNIDQTTWIPRHLVDCSTCPSTIGHPHQDTKFIVEVKDIYGCGIIDTISVYIKNLNAPITLHRWVGMNPNDPTNNTLVIEDIILYPDNAVSVYNVWGQRVAYLPNYTNNWRGTMQNGSSLPDGSYIVLVEINAINQGENHKIYMWILIYSE